MQTLNPDADQTANITNATFDDLVDGLLLEREAASLLRTRRVVTHIGPTRILTGGIELLHFSGNGYLGLSHSAELMGTLAGGLTKATSGLPQGSSAAALIAGHSPQLEQAECDIAQWKSAQSAAILPSGYQANMAAVQTAAQVAIQSGKRPRFIFDKLIHASLIDAVRATAAEFRVYPHQNLSKLRRLLEESDDGNLDILVSESVFSMDGDAADLITMAQLKQEFGFVWILDEAHASGIVGPEGAGLAHEMGVASRVDLGIVTLSKAVGVLGGAVYGTRSAICAVINFGRAYIYTTAISPAQAELISRAVALVRSGDDRRARLPSNVGLLREKLERMKLNIPVGISPIIPIIIGDEARTTRLAAALRERGIFVPAVRPPTVPAGTSRLRITLSSEHTMDDIDRLVTSLAELV